MSSLGKNKRTIERTSKKKDDAEDIKKAKILKTDSADQTKADAPPEGQVVTKSVNSKKTVNISKLKSKDKVGKNSSDDTLDSTESTDRKSPYFKGQSKDPEEEDEASVEDLGEASKDQSSERLTKAFFEKPCEDLAKALLGQVLVRKHNGERLAGKIIETESYLGRKDKAAHSYKGKTDRNTAMFMDPGTSYVYNIYGIYCCMNISSQGEGEAVLIRSLEPLEGKPVMTTFRTNNRKKEGSSSKPMKEKDLCNGPSKLTQALNINKATVNQVDLTSSDIIWVEKGEAVPDSKLVISKRINIAYAEEWTDKPLRFYELGNPCVSVKDKEVEKLMKQT